MIEMNLEDGTYTEHNPGITTALTDFLKKTDVGRRKPYDWSSNAYLKTDDELQSMYFFFGSAIDFKFWNLNNESGEIVRIGKDGLIGSDYLWTTLTRAVQEGELDLFKLSKHGIRRWIYYTFSGAGDSMTAIDQRIKNWLDLSKKLKEYWGGYSLSLIEVAGNSLSEYLQYMRQFRAFDDPLCKLSTLNSYFHVGRGLTTFKDPLLPCIDYHIIRLMLRLGAVEILDERLEDAIIQGKVMWENPEMRELRNSCMKSLQHVTTYTGISGELLDNYLWFLAKKTCNDQATPATCKFCDLAEICQKNLMYHTPWVLTRWY